MLLVSGSTRSVGRLAARYPDRLGHLLTPANRNGMAALESTGLWWACDNGCYRGLDAPAFRRMLRKVAGRPRLLWVACPDVVGDAAATLNLWGAWSGELAAAGVPRAFVVQDGQEDLPLPRAECYFLGGTTRFKLSAAAAGLGAEAKRRGALLHVGRVNSRRRMDVAQAMGADSIDGSSASMFGERYIGKYLAWLGQLSCQPRLF